MSDIEVEPGLIVRFPRREPVFSEGVEIGLLLADLASERAEIVRLLSPGTIGQARAIAERFGYRCLVGEGGEAGERVELRCLKRGLKPRLSVVR
jgi:hypothetical protein